MMRWGYCICTGKNDRQRLYMQSSFCFFLAKSLRALRKCMHTDETLLRLWFGSGCSRPVPEEEGDSRRDGAGQWPLRQLPLWCGSKAGRLRASQLCPSLNKARSNSSHGDFISRVFLTKEWCLVCVTPPGPSKSCSISSYVKSKAIDF